MPFLNYGRGGARYYNEKRNYFKNGGTVNWKDKKVTDKDVNKMTDDEIYNFFTERDQDIYKNTFGMKTHQINKI